MNDDVINSVVIILAVSGGLGWVAITAYLGYCAVKSKSKGIFR